MASYISFSAFSLNYSITRSDGVSTVTEALAITSYGIAAGIAGQGGLATKSQAGSTDLAPSSSQQCVFREVSSDLGIPQGNTLRTSVFDFYWTKHEADSDLKVSIYLNCYSPDDFIFDAYVLIDDTQVQTGSTDAKYDNQASQAKGTMTVLTMVHAVGAGQHHMVVQLTNKETDASGPLIVRAKSVMFIEELKQSMR